tara:strand:+ start:1507 stop:2682 length:1176 start_codon:yes stop_codon:yes gene_type:complete
MPKNGDNGLFDNVTFGDYIEINEDGSTPGVTEDETTKNAKSEELATDSGDKGKTTSTETLDSNEDLIEIDTQSDQEEDNTSASTEENKAGTSSSSPFSSVIDALGAEGFINFTAEEIAAIEDGKEADFIREKLNDEISNKVKTSISPKQKEALEAFEKGVAMEAYVESNARETTYSNVTADQIDGNEQTQFTLVVHSLMAKGMDKAEAEDYAKTVQDVGGDKLRTKAYEAQKALVANEKFRRQEMLSKAEEQKEANNKRREQDLEDTKTYVNSQAQIIEDLPLTDAAKEKIYKSMTVPVGKDEQGNLVSDVGQTRGKDSRRFDMLVSYYHSMGLFGEKPDFSKIKKLAETKIAKGLDSLVHNDTGFIGSGSSKSTKPKGNNSDDDLGLDFI